MGLRARPECAAGGRPAGVETCITGGAAVIGISLPTVHSPQPDVVTHIGDTYMYFVDGKILRT